MIRRGSHFQVVSPTFFVVSNERLLDLLPIMYFTLVLSYDNSGKPAHMEVANMWEPSKLNTTSEHVHEGL